MEYAALQSEIRATVQAMLQQTQTPGAAIAMLFEGEPLFDGSVGFRDAAGTETLPDDARFYIYSITKTMVAVAVLQLVERGELTLDHPVQDYLPPLAVTAPISLKQLLNHTSGLPDYGSLAAYTEAVQVHPQRPWTRAEFLENTLQGPLLFAPGDGWRYSNIGYLLLVQVLEKHYRQPLRDLLAKQIFAPLNLRFTHVADSLQGAEKLSPGYTTFFSSDGKLADMRTHYHPGWVAHGLAVSTAGELAHFFQALFDGRLLDASLLDLMRQPHIVPGSHPLFRQPAYGLGLMLDPQSPYGMTAGHGGGGPGYATGALHFSNVGGQQVVSVALANRDQPELGLQLAINLVDLLASQF